MSSNVTALLGKHSPRGRWIFALVKRLDESCQLGRDRYGCEAGSVDRRQAKLPVMVPVTDSVR